LDPAPRVDLRDCWSEAYPEGTFEIVLVSLADGTTRVLHELPNLEFGWPVISLSPDGRYLAYGGPVAADDERNDIWLLPTGGGNEIPMIQHPADDVLFGWVPGTNQILFLSDRDGTWDLWVAPIRDGAIMEPPRKLQRDLGKVDPVGFSQDGSFFYSVFTRRFTATVAPFDPITGMPDFDGAKPLLGSNRDLHWSPDGSYLAFVTEPVPPEGKRGRLNVLHLSTGERRELVPHVWVRRVGDWSPDGDRILVVGADETQQDARFRQGVYAVDVASGKVTPLLPDEDWAVWSSDGRGIIYIPGIEPGLPGQIIYRDLASGEERQVSRDALIANERPLDLSPDRRHLTYLYWGQPGRPGGGGLGILDMDEGAARRIVTLGDSVNGEAGSVQWTPDGKYIVYGGIVHGDGWRTHVWRIPVSGGEPEHLWTMGEGKYGSWFELSPDGRQIAVFTYTQESEIWVMENLREVLRSNTGR
jgi:Tol biopolymer transport system component